MKHTFSPGLVLHLDTAELVRLGAICTDGAETAVQGSHFFLCIQVDAKQGAWTPTFSDPGPGRKRIESDQKEGHQKWTSGNTYYNPLQLWLASHKTIHSAAKMGKDMSSGNAPNRVSGAAIPDRADFPDFPSGGANKGDA